MKVLKEAKNPHIERNKRRNLGIAAFLLCLTVCLVLLGIMLTLWLLPAACIPLASSTVFVRRYHIWQAGARGEDIVARSLQKLDDSYCLLNSVVLPGGKGDIDHVLLGSNGVFVIEAKNYSGRVMCDGDDWYRIKRGAKEKTRAESVSEQVKRNALDLRDFIRQTTDLSLRVSPICVFMNPSVRLDLKNPTVPIMRVGKLTKYIARAEPKLSLSETQITHLGQSIREASLE